MSGPQAPRANRPPEDESGSGRRWRLARSWQDPFNRFVLFFLLYLGIVSYLFPKLRFGFPALIGGASELAASIVYWMLRPFVSEILQIDGG